MNPPITIESPDDPRVSDYMSLKDRDIARSGDRFIAQGELVVRRLLASDYPVESVYVVRRKLDEIAPLVPAGAMLFVASDEVLRDTVGFKFHTGVAACGRRKSSPSIDDVMSAAGPRATLLICPEIASAENLGSLIRIAAAFGADAMVLGERSCDPFWRQSIRVSMGTIFSLPIVRSTCILDDLERLQSRWGVELAATVLDIDAEPLATARRRERFALLFGNEAQGLAAEHVQACDRRVTIPMKRGTDSLNVSVAAGIFLYHFTSEACFAHS